MASAIPITHEQIEKARANRARGIPIGVTAAELGVSRNGLNAALLRSDRKMLAKWEPKRRRELCRQIDRLEDVYRDARAEKDLTSALKALAELRSVLRLDELDLTPKGAGDDANRTVIVLPDNGRGRAGEGAGDDEGEDD